MYLGRTRNLERTRPIQLDFSSPSALLVYSSARRSEWPDSNQFLLSDRNLSRFMTGRPIELDSLGEALCVTLFSSYYRLAR